MHATVGASASTINIGMVRRVYHSLSGRGLVRSRIEASQASDPGFKSRRPHQPFCSIEGKKLDQKPLLFNQSRNMYSTAQAPCTVPPINPAPREFFRQPFFIWPIKRSRKRLHGGPARTKRLLAQKFHQKWHPLHNVKQAPDPLRASFTKYVQFKKSGMDLAKREVGQIFCCVLTVVPIIQWTSRIHSHAKVWRGTISLAGRTVKSDTNANSECQCSSAKPE